MVVANAILGKRNNSTQDIAVELAKASDGIGTEEPGSVDGADSEDHGHEEQSF